MVHMESKTYFLAVAYGESYVRLLAVAIESLLASLPDPRIIVEIGGVDEVSSKIFELSFPNVEVKISSFEFNSIGGKAAEPSAKVSGWRRLLEEVPNGDRALFFDADVLFTENFSTGIFSKADLAFTVKQHKWPLNSGVVAARASEGVRSFFDEWLVATETILSNPGSTSSANLDFGAPDQGALARVFEKSGISKQNLKQGTVKLEDGNVVSFVPCEIWNEVRSVPIAKETKIIHFKTTWHRILFRLQSFYHGRPEETSREMYDAWRESYRRFRARASNAVLEHLATSANQWEVSPEDYKARGVLNSEIALFLSAARFARATVVVESGRANGHSTRVLARNLERTETRFYSVELSPIATTDEELAHLFGQQPGFSLIVGDSRVEVLSLLNQYPGERFAVLIDGPKGMRSIDFARRLVAEPNVSLVAIHDLRAIVDTKPSSIRNAFENSFEFPLFSDALVVVNSLSEMDEGFRRHSSPDYATPSAPGYQGRQYIASYGPTLGILFPDFIDRERMFERIKKTPDQGNGLGALLGKIRRRAARIITNLLRD